MAGAAKRRAKDIITRGCSNEEYMRIYRAPTLEDRINVAVELDVIDRGFYRRLIQSLKSDPEMRNVMRCVCAGVFMGWCLDAAVYGVFRLAA